MKTKNHPLTEDEFKYFYSKVPRIVVEIIVKTPKGIVLTKRAIEPGTGTWHIPGGSLLRDETLEQATIRIAEEELGVKVENLQQLDTLQYVNTPNSKVYQGVSVLFLATTPKTEFNLDFQASEYGLFTDIPENTIEEHADYLKQNKSAIFD